MAEPNTIIHNRSRTWQIALYACNNTATNLYMYLMNYITYYATGYLGMTVLMISHIVMIMRVWDGVTDPFVAYVLDKTNGRFGKNRPFIVAGQIIMMIGTILMFQVIKFVPGAAQLPLFLLVYLVYIIGYTCQCIVTKSAQTCMTNDPKQRPTFSIFDGLYTSILFAVLPMLISNVWEPKYGGFNQGFFNEYLIFTIIASAILSALAFIGIAKKDVPENYGLGEDSGQPPIRLRDYWDVFKHNRAIQMLVLSGCSDKLGTQIRTNSTVAVIIFGIVCGNYALYGRVSIITFLPNLVILILGMKLIAGRMGQKTALLVGSLGAIAFAVFDIILFVVGDPTTLSFTHWNLFSILFVVFIVGQQGFSQISGSIVIPMTADCADYETYRSGRYVPGLMGSLFSFIDKLISSLSVVIVGNLCAAIGFREELPQADTPFTPELKAVGLFLMFGVPILGWILNLVAMKFYPLNKEKMEEIQAGIAEIKAKSKEAA